MATTFLHTNAQDREQSWPLWPFHLALAILFLGPIISPLFRATGLPILNDSGLLARDLLATYVCPTPAKSYLLLGLPMAVCARCWGATIGLLLARMAFAAAPSTGWIAASLHAIVRLPWIVRLIVCGLPFLLWPLEIIGEARGWWIAPRWALLLNGAQAGFAAGIFFCSLWPGLRTQHSIKNTSTTIHRILTP